MPEEEQQRQFVPLSLAAAIAYGSLSGAQQKARDYPDLEAHLDRIASGLASILPVFSGVNGARPTILPPAQVAQGTFRRGGELLFLPGAREPIESLRVRNADLYPAIEQLRQRLALPAA